MTFLVQNVNFFYQKISQFYLNSRFSKNKISTFFRVKSVLFRIKKRELSSPLLYKISFFLTNNA